MVGNHVVVTTSFYDQSPTTIITMSFMARPKSFSEAVGKWTKALVSIDCWAIEPKNLQE